MKVTEEEVNVIEEEVTVYLCDRCGDKIGEDVDNTVVTNPRLITYPDMKSLSHYEMVLGEEATSENIQKLQNERKRTFHELDEFHNVDDRIRTSGDEEWEWCGACVREVFKGTSVTPSTNTNIFSKCVGFFEDVANGLADVIHSILP